MTRHRAGGPAVGPGLVLLAVLAAPPAPARGGPDDAAVKELTKQWPALDRAGKLAGLMRVCGLASPALLKQCRRWLDDADPVVRGQVVRMVGTLARNRELSRDALALLKKAVDRHLDARARREKQEFDQVCREFGRKLPPDDAMAAGASWKDPWDETRRAPPDETRAERTFMLEVVAAIEGTRAPELRESLLRILREHHDPEVVVRAIAACEAWAEWQALLDLADLLRVQQQGRPVGGADVVGAEAFTTMRLKWDLHRDRLWWSRPEYLPRAIRPIQQAVRAIVGQPLDASRALDRWLLDHEAELLRHGVKLTREFRARAGGT